MKGDFQWMPAAMTYGMDGGIGIYVRYVQNRNLRSITVSETGNGHLIIRTPDRDLVLVGGTHTNLGYRPMEGTYDQFIHLGLFHDHAVSDMGLGYQMVNYLAESIKKKSANARIDRSEATGKPNICMVADSGGYQIGQGRVEYIDPEALARWYTQNVDLGMSLDLPMGRMSREFQIRAAKVQASNNQVMLDVMEGSGTELINVIHGATFEMMQSHLDIVDDSRVQRAAVGLIYDGAIMQGIHKLYRVMTELRPFQQYHVLGVANPLYSTLLQRMASNGMAPLITSDSSTAIQKARLREYHVNRGIHERQGFVRVGFSAGYRPSARAILPCSCPVCAAIKYADVLWCLDGNIACKVFEMHNIFSMQHYYRHMKELTDTLTTKELKEVLSLQISSRRSGFAEAMHCVDFIDSVRREGLEVMAHRYHFYLDEGLASTHAPLDSGLADDVEWDDESEGDFSPERAEYCDSILKRYESASETRNHLKKIKTEKSNSRIGKTGATGVSRKASSRSEVAQNIKGRVKLRGTEDGTNSA